MLNQTVNCSWWVSFKIDYLILAEADVVAFTWDKLIDVCLEVGISYFFLGQVLHERFLFHIVVSWKNEGAINVWRLLDEPNQNNHVVTRHVQQKEPDKNHNEKQVAAMLLQLSFSFSWVHVLPNQVRWVAHIFQFEFLYRCRVILDNLEKYFVFAFFRLLGLRLFSLLEVADTLLVFEDYESQCWAHKFL